MTNKEHKLLEWLGRSSPLLESQVVASGLSNQLNTLLIRNLADMGAHPTVRAGGAPAASVSITEGGREVLRTTT